MPRTSSPAPTPTLRQRPLKRVKEHAKLIGMYLGMSDDSTTTRDAITRAWKHILTESGNDESATIEAYRQAVRSALDEAEARSMFVNTRDDFVTIMIEEGCFILQVALCSLGGSKALDYPPNDPIFGEQKDRQQLRNWVTSMFCIRKQIPLVVLYQLMEQSFFKRVLTSKKWKRPQDLLRKTLFDFLVVPPLNTNTITREHLGIPILDSRFSDLRRNLQRQPSTLLHALWLLLTGPETSQKRDHEDDNDDDDDDEDGESEKWVSVRSATELKDAGINFKSNEEKGTRGIQFKKGFLNADLYLPSISIEPDSTKFVLENLIRYEELMYSDIKRREISGYLQFMRRLIRSPEDVKLLADDGIIHTDPRVEDELPGILKKLELAEVGNDQNLALVRGQIRVYGNPKWFSHLCSLTVFLALLQTTFTVLSYFRSQK